MIRRRRRGAAGGLLALLTETRELVGKLVLDNRKLRAQNQRLQRQLDRVSQGWDELRKLARSAPRRRRR